MGQALARKRNVRVGKSSYKHLREKTDEIDQTLMGAPLLPLPPN